MLKNIDAENEKQELKEKLDDLANLWARVHDEAKERKDSLSNVFNKAKGREEKESGFDSWLNVTEKNLRELKPVSCVPNELDVQKKELNVSIVKRGVIYDFSASIPGGLLDTIQNISSLSQNVGSSPFTSP